MDRLRLLGFESYADYLVSEHWQDVKRRYRASKLPQGCAVCGESETQLHHRTYKRLGRERLDDLVPLCDVHHERLHEHLTNEEASSLWVASARFITSELNARARSAGGGA